MLAQALAYGTVFGITVGFGAALIGEAVDYSAIISCSPAAAVAAWRQRFWPTVRLGVLTSVFGFAGILFSGFPGWRSWVCIRLPALLPPLWWPATPADLAGPLPGRLAERPPLALELDRPAACALADAGAGPGRADLYRRMSGRRCGRLTFLP